MFEAMPVYTDGVFAMKYLSCTLILLKQGPLRGTAWRKGLHIRNYVVVSIHANEALSFLLAGWLKVCLKAACF